MSVDEIFVSDLIHDEDAAEDPYTAIYRQDVVRFLFKGKYRTGIVDSETSSKKYHKYTLLILSVKITSFLCFFWFLWEIY